jgi:putative peptidoglycan lipid II flippase
MFIDKSLALYLGNYAVPALYYSDRIVFITIGIFAVSLNTVMLPDMSGFAVRKDYKGLSNGISSGVRHMLFICIPAAVFTFMFRFEIIRLLFMRGAFDTEALNETAFALAFYSLGIPFFATVKILVSAFHSQKKMMLPVRISIICICVNIVLNIVLMQYIRQGGIALATVIASLLNNVILFYFLRRDLSHLKMSDILYSGVMILLAALAAGVSAYMTVHYFLTGLSDLKAILILFSVFSIVFLSVSALLRLDELGDWLNIIRRKRV